MKGCCRTCCGVYAGNFNSVVDPYGKVEFVQKRSEIFQVRDVYNSLDYIIIGI